MEIYVLDPSLQRHDIIDKFESFIWTERFQESGDFELVLPDTPNNRSILTVGTRLAIEASRRVMVIETVKETSDDLKIEGHSLESILSDRVAKDTMSDTTTEPTWSLTGTPGEIARQIFHDICILGNLSPLDIIPGVIEDNILFPEDTIVEPADDITVELSPTTVYIGVSDICNEYDLGFRLVRNFDTSELYFDIYAGCDRTSGQAVLPAVIFSEELDNLENVVSIKTTKEYKNVAYVFSKVGYEVVYAPGIEEDDMGPFDRRVLVVVDDETESTDPPTASAQMRRHGYEELAKHRAQSALDGEVSETSEYIYGEHYNLGDLVEMREKNGSVGRMRVTEQIFASDVEGDRAYPTLAIDLFIDPGTWLAWKYNQVWADFGLTEYWEDQ